MNDRPPCEVIEFYGPEPLRKHGSIPISKNIISILVNTGNIVKFFLEGCVPNFLVMQIDFKPTMTGNIACLIQYCWGKKACV